MFLGFRSGKSVVDLLDNLGSGSDTVECSEFTFGAISRTVVLQLRGSPCFDGTSLAGMQASGQDPGEYRGAER